MTSKGRSFHGSRSASWRLQRKTPSFTEPKARSDESSLQRSLVGTNFCPSRTTSSTCRASKSPKSVRQPGQRLTRLSSARETLTHPSPRRRRLLNHHPLPPAKAPKTGLSESTGRLTKFPLPTTKLVNCRISLVDCRLHHHRFSQHPPQKPPQIVGNKDTNALLPDETNGLLRETNGLLRETNKLQDDSTPTGPLSFHPPQWTTAAPTNPPSIHRTGSRSMLTYQNWREIVSLRFFNSSDCATTTIYAMPFTYAS